MSGMTKDQLLVLLEQQRQSWLSIKDFCANEAYSVSNFYYRKSKYGLTRSLLKREYCTDEPAFSGLAPVSLSSLPAFDQSKDLEDKITIE